MGARKSFSEEDVTTAAAYVRALRTCGTRRRVRGSACVCNQKHSVMTTP
jgi:hypothetical protein